MRASRRTDCVSLTQPTTAAVIWAIRFYLVSKALKETETAFFYLKAPFSAANPNSHQMSGCDTRRTRNRQLKTKGLVEIVRYREEGCGKKWKCMDSQDSRA